MSWLLKRFTEPSSYAGIAAAFSSVAHMVTTGQTNGTLIATVLAGLAAFVMPEKAVAEQPAK